MWPRAWCCELRYPAINARTLSDVLRNRIEDCSSDSLDFALFQGSGPMLCFRVHVMFQDFHTNEYKVRYIRWELDSFHEVVAPIYVTMIVQRSFQITLSDVRYFAHHHVVVSSTIDLNSLVITDRTGECFEQCARSWDTPSFCFDALDRRRTYWRCRAPQRSREVCKTRRRLLRRLSKISRHSDSSKDWRELEESEERSRSLEQDDIQQLM